MQIEPQASAFARRYARGEAQVVWTTLVADLETPVSAFLKIAGGRPMSFLLESVEGGAVRGRYSIIGLEPDLIWRRWGRGDQPHAAQRHVHDLQRAAAQGTARARHRKPDCAARHVAANGSRHLRLSRLRHGAAD
jgi:anthranilate/para-aminobenzoate synthase component I